MNILTNWAAFLIGTAITFVLSPIVVHSLGDIRYGVWGVVGSIVGYLGLVCGCSRCSKVYVPSSCEVRLSHGTGAHSYMRPQ